MTKTEQIFDNHHKQGNSSLGVVTNRLTADDKWYKSNLKGIIETQISLVESGAQKNIDRKLIHQWVTDNL